MGDERHANLDLRAYATLTASLRSLPPERAGEVLEREGLSASAWKAAAGAWTNAIEEEMAKGEHRLLLAYADELRAAEARLARQPAAPEELGPAAPSPAPDRRELPAFMIHAAEEPVAKKPVPDFALTAPVDLAAIIAAGLPFAKSLAEAAVPAPAVAKPPRPFTGTTLDLGPSRSAALPFGPIPETLEPVGTEPTARPAEQFVFTTSVDLQAIIAAVLPFAPSLERAAAATPEPAGVEPPHEFTGTTLDLGPSRFSALPFDPKPGAAANPDPPAPPELSFEQYVAVCAQLTIFPQQTDEILSRAHLTRPVLPDLHAAWRARLAADPALTQRWHALYAHYQDWFTRSIGRP